MDLLGEEDLWVEILLLNLMDEANLRKILQKPYVFIGSDAEARAHYGVLGEGVPHPRGFGTFPRVLGQFVRGEGLMPISEAIARMTWLPARRVGLAGRGRISAGMKADLVVFDPDRINDTSTYESSIHYPEGVGLVMVNGEVTVEDGAHLGTRAGRALRPEGCKPHNGEKGAC
jgi:N-acyl-D-amino-acid deacylase